jgi:formylglycine-generating enzyme required for sulfatase activity
MNEPVSPEMQALLTAVPEDPVAAFYLADFLEERDDPRGELLRLVYALTRAIEVPARTRLEQRMRELLCIRNVRPIGPYREVQLRGKRKQGAGMTFAWVPPGMFVMGSPEDEEGREPHEGPQHEVTLTRGFWMGTAPVTQDQYELVMGCNPSNHKTRDRGRSFHDAPVEEVTWQNAVAFCKRLSARAGEMAAGRVYRLSTEAEWEYACRAGTTTRFWSGVSEADLARVAWYEGNSDCREGISAHPVGKGANGWGLSDVHGNVQEWCADWYDAGFYARSPKENPLCRNSQSRFRVVRGGGAYHDATDCRSALRDKGVPNGSHNDLGFRLVADRL